MEQDEIQDEVLLGVLDRFHALVNARFREFLRTKRSDGDIESLRLDLQELADGMFPGAMKVDAGIDPHDGNPFVRFINPTASVEEVRQYAAAMKKARENKNSVGNRGKKRATVSKKK